jgi:uncharacterized membrane protein
MSDDSDLRSYTRRGALGLMGAGGVLAATETFGFSNFTRDRNLNIAVTNDLKSLLKVSVENESTSIDGQTLDQESATVYFENQSDIELTNINAVIENNGEAEVNYVPSSGFSSNGNGSFTLDSLHSGHSENIKISTQSSGTADITLEIYSDTLPELSVELSRSFHINNSST